VTESDAIAILQNNLSVLRALKPGKKKIERQKGERPQQRGLPPPPPRVNSFTESLEKLSLDYRRVVMAMMQGRSLNSEFSRREFLTDAILTIDAELACQGRCCKGLSRAERLERLCN
jgi:hypothetical protein